jgi:hypothetical protein
MLNPIADIADLISLREVKEVFSLPNSLLPFSSPDSLSVDRFLSSIPERDQLLELVPEKWRILPLFESRLLPKKKQDFNQAALPLLPIALGVSVLLHGAFFYGTRPKAEPAPVEKKRSPRRRSTRKLKNDSSKKRKHDWSNGRKASGRLSFRYSSL